MKIAIGSDKSGYVLKEAIKKYFIENGTDFDDLGTTDIENVVPYYAVASAVAPKVAEGYYDRAILVCGTGAGMNVVSNKFKGVQAVACESIYAAKQARAINGAKILCMGGWIVAPELGIEMVKTFLSTDYLQDLEDWRKTWLKNAAAKVAELEEDIYGK